VLPALELGGERSVIRFEGDQRPAVLKKKEVDQVMPRIMTQYGISQPNRTELGSRRLAKGSYQQEGESR
jgi:hypothetical protein